MPRIRNITTGIVILILIATIAIDNFYFFSYKKINNIKFDISSFKMEYKDESKDTSIDETYTGNGIINASGDENLVKKPYSVLISIKRISGGTKINYSEGKSTVIVMNGIGTFGTSDWNYKESSKMTEPKYEIKILGYMPFVETPQK